MDILFVIDDSPSMILEQESLAAAFPEFVAVIESYFTNASADIDYRVGVTTSSVNRNFDLVVPGFPNVPMFSGGPNGELVGREECALGEHPWVEGPGPDVADRFSCVATSAGTGGSGYEMPLAATILALGEHAEEGGPNEGFYRAGGDSLLVVVYLLDEDDCSLLEGGELGTTPGGVCVPDQCTGLYGLENTKLFLDDVAGGPERFVLVAIAGPGPGPCESAFGEAEEAVRLKELVAMCGEDNGVFGDICQGDLSVNLDAALEKMQEACTELPEIE